MSPESMLDVPYGEEMEEARESERPSMSPDEMIARFIQLDALYKETAAARRDLSLQLAGLAFEQKQNQNTVHLASSNGSRIKVEFGIDYEYDNEQMFTASEVLGKERFDQLFDTRIEFKAKKRALNMFLNTVHADESAETAKEIIKDATKARDKTPYVSVEKFLRDGAVR